MREVVSSPTDGFVFLPEILKISVDLNHKMEDLFGGITAEIVALPLAVAFGFSCGLAPMAPMKAVGMFAITACVTANDDVNIALPAIYRIFLLVGLMQVGLAFMGLGTRQDCVKFLNWISRVCAQW